MFGGPRKQPKKPSLQSKPSVMQRDICMPHGTNNQHAHRGGDRKNDYAKKLLLYNQRELELADKYNAAELKRSMDVTCKIIHQTSTDGRRFRHKIQERLKIKLAQYEEQIDKRRERLRDILAMEEREHIRETVDKQQNADANMLQEKRDKCALLRASKEAERLDIVKKKRIQQYAARSLDLRPHVNQTHLMESKAGQLQQIRENEMRREMERELDKMWADVVRRQEEAFLERETHEALMKYERQKKDREILDLQVKAKQTMEAEKKEIERLNREELRHVREVLKQKEEDDLKEQHLKREQTAAELREQLRTQEEFAAKRKKDEHALDQAMKHLAELECRREKAKISDNRERLKREVATYREHIHQLEMVRKEEEQQFDELTAKFRVEDQKVQDEKKCKLQEAKMKLHKSVMDGRDQQLQHNRQKAEDALKFKEEENHVLRTILAKNVELDAEARRLQTMAAKQYRNDLKKQIEYNKLIREREIKALEEQLEQGLAEENHFRSLVNELLENISAVQGKHPFRMVLEQYDCHCPEESK